MSQATPFVSVSPTELVELCALDSQLYCRTFFPSTFRQESPPFHQDIWDLLEDRNHRYVAIEVFRGGAKTTLLRSYTSKRIAYGTSRTILFVSEAQTISEDSIKWLKHQISTNKDWATVYGLRRGTKWTDEEIQIQNDTLGVSSTIRALGITGQVRGINVEDYRPDLIVVDDPCDEENTATPEQRLKTSNLFFGALEKSLTPETECPEAKQILLQTPLAREDLISLCLRDPQWASRVYGCFDLKGESRWPARYPTEKLQRAKDAHIARNQLALWMREMECTLVAAETCDFREEWLQYYEDYDLPKNMLVYLAIDPVPPPSERELAVGLRQKDFEVICAIGARGPDRFLLDLARSREHSPEWTKAKFFEMVDRWRPIKAKIESIGYQRVLKTLLEQEMARRQRWVQIDATPDKRAKSTRIRQAISGIAAAKHLFVRRGQVSFIDQFITYPNCNHDDDLDAVAMALEAARTGPRDMEDELAEDEASQDYEIDRYTGKRTRTSSGWRQAP